MDIKQVFLKFLGRGPFTVNQLRKYGATVGEDVYIGTRRIDLGHARLLEIGNHVTLSDCRLLLHDGSTKRPLGYSKIGRIVIGDNVFIGADAVILPNVKIGNNTIIGAGSIITKDIPENSIVVGNPGKVISSYDNYVAKCKNIMESSPIYNTYCNDKTEMEWEIIKDDLMDGGFGFDI